MRTKRLAISGRVDRIDERDGELVIVDYKTGRSRLDTDDARGSLALALYALAAERTLHQPCRRVELHHLPTGDVAGFDHTDGSLQRHVDRAEQTAADIVAATDTVQGGADPAEVFEPVPGSILQLVRLPTPVPGRSGGLPAQGQLVRPGHSLDSR